MYIRFYNCTISIISLTSFELSYVLVGLIHPYQLWNREFVSLILWGWDSNSSRFMTWTQRLMRSVLTRFMNRRNGSYWMTNLIVLKKKHWCLLLCRYELIADTVINDEWIGWVGWLCYKNNNFVRFFLTKWNKISNSKLSCVGKVSSWHRLTFHHILSFSELLNTNGSLVSTRRHRDHSTNGSFGPTGLK